MKQTVRQVVRTSTKRKTIEDTLVRPSEIFLKDIENFTSIIGVRKPRCHLWIQMYFYKNIETNHVIMFTELVVKLYQHNHQILTRCMII